MTNIDIEDEFNYNIKAPTTFIKTEGRVFLRQLTGLSCGFCGKDEGPLRTRGLFLLKTDVCRYEADDFILLESSFTETAVSMVWRVSGGFLQIESNWTFCPNTGVISRKDRVFNTGDTEVTMLGAFSRFPFTASVYEVYSQGSSWCSENQGSWQDLRHGSYVLGCEGGRTSQGSTPYMCIRDKGHKQGAAFHVIPYGNWRIHISAHNAAHGDAGVSMPHAIVEIGPSDEDMRMKLPANGVYDMPEILIHHLLQGGEGDGTAEIHRYLLDNHLKGSRKTAPLVYNTWFDDFDFIDTDRLVKQLKIARVLDCEVFTVDAGWFGGETGNWYEQSGDWREKQDGAFHGKMGDFAEEVRANGLGFGLWMEPERIGKSTPIFKEHPEWFIPVYNGFCYPDLANPVVYGYIFGEISRLIEKYKLAWIKLDFNFEFGADSTGSEFHFYYLAWYRILKELGEKYPEVFFENCASGGQRLNINDLEHSNGAFISDTVNPKEVLRILQGALLRLPPGRLIKWTVLRSIKDPVPVYGIPVDTAPESIIAPSGATWESFMKVDLDFAVRVAMPGVLSLGGDLSSLPDWAVERLKYHCGFYRKWRDFMVDSVAYLLTPVLPKGDSSGWVAVQLQDSQDTYSLLFVYRLEDSNYIKRVYLRGLKDTQSYEVKYENGIDTQSEVFSGFQLMSQGVPVHVAKHYNAEVLSISRKM